MHVKTIKIKLLDVVVVVVLVTTIQNVVINLKKTILKQVKQKNNFYKIFLQHNCSLTLREGLEDITKNFLS